MHMSLILKFQEGVMRLKLPLRGSMAHSLVADGAGEVAVDIVDYLCTISARS